MEKGQSPVVASGAEWKEFAKTTLPQARVRDGKENRRKREFIILGASDHWVPWAHGWGMGRLLVAALGVIATRTTNGFLEHGQTDHSEGGYPTNSQLPGPPE